LRHFLLSLLFCLFILPPGTWAQGPGEASATNSTAQEEQNPLVQLVETYSQMSSFSFRVGNFLASARILTSFEDFLLSLAKHAPGQEAEVAQAQVGLRVLQFVNLAFAGQPTTAIEMGNKLVGQAGSDEEILIALRMVLLHAGRAAGRPQVVDHNLPIVLKMAYATKDDSANLYKFAAETIKFERELQKNPQVDTPSFVARHNKVWGLLKGYRVGEEESQGEGRLFSEGLRFWMVELTHRAAAAKDPAEKALMKKLFQEDVNVGVDLSNQGVNVTNKVLINPEFFVGLVDGILDVAEGMRAEGDTAAAREVLKLLETEFMGMVTVFKTADVEMNKTIGDAVQLFLSVVPELEKEGITFDPKPFQFSLMEGDISRLAARHHQQWVRQIMSEAGSKLTTAQVDEIKKHLAIALEAQVKASKGLGYLGMDDVGWDVLEVLFARRSEGWIEAAQEQIKNELAICQALNYRPGLIAAHSYLGQLQAAQSQKPAAMESLKKATGLAEEYILEVGGGSAAASRIKARYRKAYDLLTELQIEAKQPDEAFSTLGRMQQMQAVASSANLEGNAAVSKVTALRGQSQALQQELVARKATGQDTKPTEQLLAKTKGEFFTALATIRTQNPQYESLLAIRPVNFSKLQKFIPADTAIVQYFPSETALYIFVATNKDLKIHKVGATAQELKGLVEAFRRVAVRDYLQYAMGGGAPLAMNSTGPSAQKLIEPLKANLFRLHTLLVDPVEADIADKAVVAFIPTGSLNYLPFSALARPAAGGVEFLAQRKQCVTLMKSSDLDQLGRKPALSKGSVLALGNPDGSLPESVSEVENIAKLFNSQAFVGKQATRDRLTKTPGIAYLHLATHGVLDARDPSASYLVMAGQADGAQLSIPQIYDLKLEGVRLVTLSACQTALGERDPGSELTTLADAFSIAGSNSVVASLWSVSDESTKDLMVEFYGQLKQGKSLANSLQSAEIKLIQSGRSHPFYWAPFVLIGDWR